MKEPYCRWLSGQEPTREQVLSEVGRELAIRRSYYAKLVAQKRLAQSESDLRIDRLQAAYDVVALLPPGQRLPQRERGT